MEDNSRPLTFEELADSVRILQEQLLATVELSNKKTETIQELVELVRIQNDDLSMVKGMAYQLQGKLAEVESKVVSNFGSGTIYLSNGTYYSITEAIKAVDRNQSLESMHDAEHNRHFVALNEAFKALVRTLPESSRAEALSTLVMEIDHKSVPTFSNFIWSNHEILRTVADLLDQPESIITLHK